MWLLRQNAWIGDLWIANSETKTFLEHRLKVFCLNFSKRKCKHFLHYLKRALTFSSILQEKRKLEREENKKARAEARAKAKSERKKLKEVSKEQTSSAAEKASSCAVSRPDIATSKSLSVASVSSVEVVYQQGLAGTGQPFVEYPQLDLEFYALFALGSPIGMFLTVRWERSSTVGNLRGSSHYSLFSAAGRTILRLREALRRVGERFAAGLVLIIISARPLADLSPARISQGIIPSRRLSSCRSADNEGLLQGYRRLFQLL